MLTTRSLPLGALFAAIGLLCALASRTPGARAALSALPAFLVALPLPTPGLPPLPLGPVRIDGLVRTVQRAPVTGTLRVVLGRKAPGLPLAFDRDLEVLPGDHLAVLAHVAEAPAPGLARPVQAVAATAHVTAGSWSLARASQAARRALERQLLAWLPPEPGALLASLVLGRDTRPSGDVQAAHRATGLSHLLAVSGAHAAMLALLLGVGGRHARRRLLGSPVRTRLVLGLLVAYAAITGNEPPVLRAVAAYALAAIATRLGRPCGVVPLLLAPAVLTAFVQPQAMLGPSFLLSYAAVAGLFLAGNGRHESRWRRWLFEPLLASAWATLLTAPLTLLFFGQLAPWTVLLTPLLAPLVGVLLLGGLALALAGCLAPPLAAVLASPLAAATEFYAACVQWADALPGTPLVALGVVPPWLLLLVALASALLLLWRPDRRRCAFAAVLLILPHFVPLPVATSTGMQLFAIGHGQACLLTTAAGHRCAVDCGSLQQPFLAADRLVQALPRHALDLLVVTHADSDHHNGIPGLLARVRIAAAIVPEALTASALVATLQAHGTRVDVLAPGERRQPAPHLLVCAPPLPAGASDNDQSLWVSATLDGTRVLLTGDAQELGVAAALAAGIAGPHDVLVLPHHGRSNQNAPQLLARVLPRACLASAATADGETRLGPLVRQQGRELWVTGLHGSLRLGGEPLRITGAEPGRPLPPPH